MTRPKSNQPTPGELEVLKILWAKGPMTGRDVMEVLNRHRRRAYTSVMSLLSVMTDKGLLNRRPHGRAFLYQAKVAREQTLGHLLDDLLGRAFAGSARALVAHLLDHSDPCAEELAEIRKAIDEYVNRQGEG
jgi:predicted transcriptional regulator